MPTVGRHWRCGAFLSNVQALEEEPTGYLVTLGAGGGLVTAVPARHVPRRLERRSLPGANVAWRSAGQLAAGSSLAQYLHFVAAAGTSADRQ